MRKSKGQFIIITTLFIVIIMLTVLPRLYMVSLQHRFIKYESYKEVIDNVNTDFERVMERALALASLKYSESNSLSEANSTAYDLIAKWLLAVIKAHSGSGVQVKFIPRNGLINISWLHPASNSSINGEIHLNLTGYGLYGDKYSASIMLRIEINESTITIDNSTLTCTFNFTALKEHSEPVNSLTKSSLKILYTYDRTEEEANITDLTYYGSGLYEVTFEVSNASITEIKLYVTDDRSIMVVAKARVA